MDWTFAAALKTRLVGRRFKPVTGTIPITIHFVAIGSAPNKHRVAFSFEGDDRVTRQMPAHALVGMMAEGALREEPP